MYLKLTRCLCCYAVAYKDNKIGLLRFWLSRFVKEVKYRIFFLRIFGKKHVYFFRPL